MKKVILSLAFVLATGFSVNANKKMPKGKSIFIEKDIFNLNETSLKKTILEKVYILDHNNFLELNKLTFSEYFSCLMDAYNFANRAELQFTGKQYGWSIEMWTAVMNFSFNECQKGTNISLIYAD